MKLVPLTVLSAALVLLVPAVACNEDHSPTSPENSHDALALQSINPMGGTLPAGTVRGEAAVHWTMVSATTGQLRLTSWWEDRLVETFRVEKLQQLGMRRGDTSVSFLVALPAESEGRTRVLKFELVPQGEYEATASFEVRYTVASQ